MSAPRLEPYATLDAAGIPRHVLGERFAAVCERLEDTAPAWATESDIHRKAGLYLDDRGSLDWEDEDMCELPGTEKQCGPSNLTLEITGGSRRANLRLIDWLDGTEGRYAWLHTITHRRSVR